MKDRRLAARYARALLSALPEPRQAEAADEFLQALAEAMDESAAFRQFLLDPAVARPERIAVLRRLADARGLPERMGNFLSTLVDHGRVGILPSIALVFHELREDKLGIVPAEVTTAQPMTEEMLSRTREALQRLTGRRVRLETRVDPALLGGAVTRIGSTIYDGSLRSQLMRLRREMIQE